MDDNYHLQRFVVEKLCGETMRLVEDTGVDSADDENVGMLAPSDAEGIDRLADAIMVGGQDWTRQKLAINLVSERWFHCLLKLILALRRYVLHTYPCEVV